MHSILEQCIYSCAMHLLCRRSSHSSLVEAASFMAPLRDGAQLAPSFFGIHPTRHPRGEQAAFLLLPPVILAVNQGVASRVGPEKLSATRPVPPLGSAP